MTTAVKNVIRPVVRGQHGDGGEYIEHVDEEGFEDENIDPEVSEEDEHCQHGRIMIAD